MNGALAQVPGRAVGALLVLLGGCAPALDWREVRLEGPGLVATFPCRPVGQTRQVALGGTAVSMTLQACESAGRTFAVAIADMGDPAAVDAGLRALRDASLAKSDNAAPPTASDWAIDGMTPQPAAGRWQFSQRRPSGEALLLDTAVFARGTWVIQASVIGETAGRAASAPFFDGLHLAP